MKFCPKCSSMMMPRKEGSDTVYACSCGYSEKGSNTVLTSTAKAKEIEKIEAPQQSADERLPTCKAECPECGNKEAYYWEIQTRASDEPPTRFSRCTKCKHTWREYN